MILVDSNILIYSAEDEHKYLRMLFKEPNSAVSIISTLEVLGYHSITQKQIIYFKSIFEVIEIVSITNVLIEEAIAYRQKKSMSVADSISGNGKSLPV